MSSLSAGGFGLRFIYASQKFMDQPRKPRSSKRISDKRPVGCHAANIFSTTVHSGVSQYWGGEFAFFLGRSVPVSVLDMVQTVAFLPTATEFRQIRDLLDAMSFATDPVSWLDILQTVAFFIAKNIVSATFLLGRFLL